MHHRKTYMHINVQQNRVSKSVKTVHTNIFAKNSKLHNFATIGKKSIISDIHRRINVHEDHFFAKSGKQISQHRAHKYICKNLQIPIVILKKIYYIKHA